MSTPWAAALKGMLMSDGFMYADCGLTCHIVWGNESNPVPEHSIGCSNCGCVLDRLFGLHGYIGPVNYCPRCGAKVIKDE